VLIKKFSEKVNFSCANNNNETCYVNINNPYPLKSIYNELDDKNDLFKSNLDININEVEEKSNIKKSIKSCDNKLEKDSIANLEKYFLTLIEQAVLIFMQNDFKEAFIEFNIAKFLLEQIIFIRLISENQQKQGENKFFDKEKFLRIINIIDMDNEINIDKEENIYNCQQENKEFFQKIKRDNNFLFTFIGGFLGYFNEKNIIVKKNSFDIASEEKSVKIQNPVKNNSDFYNKNDHVDWNKMNLSKNLLSLISFHRDIVNMISECFIKN